MTAHRRSLEAVRAQLASMQAVTVEPLLAEGLTDLIDFVDDQIVEDLRVEQWVKDAQNNFDMERFARDFAFGMSVIQ